MSDIDQLTQQRIRARRLRHEQTDAEKSLWQALRSRQLSGFKFRRQHPVGSYITDFCCLNCKLIIELDGGQHALETKADDRRSHFLSQQGYHVLRFWNHEVLTNLEGVLQRIVESAQRPSTFPSPPWGEGRMTSKVSAPFLAPG